MFVVFGPLRSGTTFLMNILNNFEQTDVFQEIYNPILLDELNKKQYDKLIINKNIDFKNDYSKCILYDEKLLNYKFKHPFEFLDIMKQNSCNEYFCFKLLFTQFGCIDFFNNINDFEKRNIKPIIIHRKPIDGFISIKRIDNLKKNYVLKDIFTYFDYTDISVELDIDEFIKYYDLNNDYYKKLQKHFKNCLIINYDKIPQSNYDKIIYLQNKIKNSFKIEFSNIINYCDHKNIKKK